jgi:hypothetical protein
LKIAFFHYHLDPGGVTSVIQHQAAALAGTCETLAVTSAVPARPIGADVIPVPLAAYDNKHNSGGSGEDLANALLAAIRSKWPGGCDVLHVHNPTLAKNRRLPKALEILKDKGVRLFLQIHDFAEDGRPDVYYHEEYTAGVHYGVINSRDYDLLIKAGLKKEGLHMLPNQVKPFDIQTPANDGYVLYPVRAIRRKNIGEALLLSLFLDKTQVAGITQPPTNPLDLEHYTRWKAFTREHNLNVELEVGVGGNYNELVKHAQFVFTSSLNEGFGFAFLEPWTAGKMVVGRRLAHVCRDFQRQGVDLGHLYDAFRIPLHCIDCQAVYEKWRQSLMRQARAFNHRLEPAAIRAAFDAITRGSAIDFGVLDEENQMSALLEIKHSSAGIERTRRLNPWLETCQGASSGIYGDVIAHNDRIIRDRYSGENYRKRLLRIYEQVLDAPVTHRIERGVLLNAFFDPLQYKMLKWREV